MHAASEPLHRNAATVGVGAQRAALSSERLAIRTSFESGELGRDLLHRLALLTDRHLRLAWKVQQMPQGASLIAVGGYGRGQLFPYSDVDILILLPGAPDEALKSKLEDRKSVV